MVRHLQTLDSEARRLFRGLTDHALLRIFRSRYLSPGGAFGSIFSKNSELSEQDRSLLEHLAGSLRKELEHMYCVRCGQLNAPGEMPVEECKKRDRYLQKRAEVAELLLEDVYLETVSDCFTDTSFGTLLLLDDLDIRRHYFTISDPTCSGSQVLRTMLLPGLLARLGQLQNSERTAPRLFEIGRVFRREIDGKPPQETTLVCGVSGCDASNKIPVRHGSLDSVNDYDARSTVNFLFDRLGLTDSAGADIKIIHPVQEGVEKFCEPDYALLAFAGGTFLGSIGKINSEVLRNFGIRHDVSYFELNFDTLCEL